MTDEARCPLHDAPATDACSRCGRLVCITCQRLRDTDVFCEACRALVPDARPLTGWMLASALTMSFAPLNLVLALGALWTGLRELSLDLLEDPQARWWVVKAGLVVAGEALLTVLAAVTAARLLSRRRVAPVLAQAFFAATVATEALAWWLRSADGVEPPVSAVTALVAALVWLVVFRRSKAGEAVFVR